SSRRRHTRSDRDWSSDVCSSDLIAAHERRHVERRREAGHAVLHQVVEAPVRVLRRPEARELAHRPEARAVHRRMDAARVRELTRRAEIALPVEASEILAGIERLDRLAGEGRKARLAFRALLHRGPVDGLEPCCLFATYLFDRHAAVTKDRAITMRWISLVPS